MFVFKRTYDFFIAGRCLVNKMGKVEVATTDFFGFRQSLVPKCGEDDPGETRMESQIAQ